ncbi:hypothetical protein AMTR_s00067p00150350 [Amborella trichopoda]|uniref:DNA/RNA-binding protein Alba-like domain-containing protein n=1 Tax=Amborella trichopoda TaxID=13333 RepID=U5DEP1_AMBTC|nr:hypothetical protein AMTR_s00067p00150350 [Amborella trichopoda]
MDRYQRVEKPRPESTINENEIRITTQGLIRNYISYATSLLQEKRVREIVLKAMGQAISKTVAIAEIIKKRMPGLHQETSISSTSITDVWEPIEEGLVPLEMTRHVSMISISLSTKELNKNSPGYQAPASLEQHPPQQQQKSHMAKEIYMDGGEDEVVAGEEAGVGVEVITIKGMTTKGTTIKVITKDTVTIKYITIRVITTKDIKKMEGGTTIIIGTEEVVEEEGGAIVVAEEDMREVGEEEGAMVEGVEGRAGGAEEIENGGRLYFHYGWEIWPLYYFPPFIHLSMYSYPFSIWSDLDFGFD